MAPVSGPEKSKRLTPRDLRAVLATSADILGTDIRSAFDLAHDGIQYFDFGTGTPPPSDPDLVSDLWYRRLLRPPYERCVFVTYQYGRRVYSICGYDTTIVAGKDETYEKACVLLVVSQYGKLLRPECLSWFVGEPNGNILAGGIPLSECDDETADSFKRFSLWSVGNFMRHCMALNTKGIRQRHEAEPRKLNQKRARTGKAPISAVTYVDLATHGAYGHSEGGGGSKCGWDGADFVLKGALKTADESIDGREEGKLRQRERA